MRFRDFLFGALLGAAAGMLLAPDSGRRSRAILKDKAVKYSHDAGEFVDKKSRHLANKAKGYAHEVSGKVSGMISRGKETAHEISEEEEVASA